MRDVQTNEAPGIARFRKLMGRFATGVCVVAVGNEETGVSGMTVNSFVSVSLEPMLVCWSLQNTSSQFDLYAEAPRFSISIIGDHQRELALRYASRADSQLRADDFVRSQGGLPIVADALGHMDCEAWSRYPAGDHTMILGEVTGLDLPDDDATGAPLGFFEGRFCRIGE
ncbi:MAG: flavin reductase family protein [Erythrobacter sp.]|uniref:flavin reductase family protein n=1 Tax=Erythrobacter sp. TaxID=1042 RepID=UPI003C70BE3A